jgi:hypothetical protein
MSAFAAGFCAMAAICSGLEWLKYREKLLAVSFWLNLIFAVLNAYFWLT